MLKMGNNKWDTVAVIIANGRHYHVAGGAASGREGVTLLEGVDGVDKLSYEVISSQAARQTGASYLDRTSGVRDMNLPFLIDGGTSLKSLRLKDRFLRDLLHDDEFCLGLFNPVHGWRWLWARATGFEEITGRDYTRRGALEVDVEATAFDPRYRSWTERQHRWLSDSTEVTISNPGDWVTYPRLVFSGPGGSSSGLEVPGHPNVLLPKLVNTLERLVVDTDPSRRRVVSSVRGTMPWTDTAYKRVALSVQPRSELTFVINTEWHQPGISQVMVFTPVYYQLGH